jgi:hypothetical protein
MGPWPRGFSRALVAASLALVALPENGLAQTRVADLAEVSIEDLMDRRYVNVNPYAFTNTQEVTGAPQNPPRFTVGVDLRIR